MRRRPDRRRRAHGGCGERDQGAEAGLPRRRRGAGGGSRADCGALGGGMRVLLVTEAGVHELLPMDACVALMRDALTTLARGDAVLPLRNLVRLPDGSGLLGLMPGYLGEPRSFGLKVVTVMPGNHGTPYDSHQGVVMLFGLVHGEPLAILDATAITAIRTAAASAAATRALARPDAG